MTMVRVLPHMVFSDVLEKLETVYGQKTLFEYQDQGGRVVTVDEALKWDRFAAMADDRSPPHPSTPHPLPSTLCCRQCCVCCFVVVYCRDCMSSKQEP